jgi:hypothetical protein
MECGVEGRHDGYNDGKKFSSAHWGTHGLLKYHDHNTRRATRIAESALLSGVEHSIISKSEDPRLAAGLTQHVSQTLLLTVMSIARLLTEVTVDTAGNIHDRLLA